MTKVKTQIYDLEERLLEYSVRIIKVVEKLPNSRTGNHVAGQLLRSGTSPYPNHGEAQAAESSRDFIHKLSISLKELRETRRWLKLIQRLPLLTKPDALNELLVETEELIKIFVTSIKTVEKKQKAIKQKPLNKPIAGQPLSGSAGVVQPLDVGC